MSKKFGRNQKRKLKQQLDDCKSSIDNYSKRNVFLHRELTRLKSQPSGSFLEDETLSFQVIKNESFSHSPSHDLFISTVQVSIKSLILNRSFSIDELDILIKNPEILIDEFTHHLNQHLTAYVPHVLNDIGTQILIQRRG